MVSSPGPRCRRLKSAQASAGERATDGAECREPGAHGVPQSPAGVGAAHIRGGGPRVEPRAAAHRERAVPGWRWDPAGRRERDSSAGVGRQQRDHCRVQLQPGPSQIAERYNRPSGSSGGEPPAAHRRGGLAHPAGGASAGRTVGQILVGLPPTRISSLILAALLLKVASEECHGVVPCIFGHGQILMVELVSDSRIDPQTVRNAGLLEDL